MPNPDGKLKVGFFCKAAILTRTESEALVIPAEALVNFAGVTRVFVIGEDGTARSREVRTGLSLGPKVEVHRRARARRSRRDQRARPAQRGHARWSCAPARAADKPAAEASAAPAEGRS